MTTRQRRPHTQNGEVMGWTQIYSTYYKYPVCCVQSIQNADNQLNTNCVRVFQFEFVFVQFAVQSVVLTVRVMCSAAFYLYHYLYSELVRCRSAHIYGNTRHTHNHTNERNSCIGE